MNYIPLLRSSLILPFLPFLHEIGTPVDRLLSVNSVPRKALAEPDSLIPVASCLAFLEQAAKAEGLPTLGLLVGQSTKMDQLGRFGELVNTSLTLFEALDTAQKLIAALNSSARLWLERHDDTAWFCHRIQTHLDLGGKLASQYALMLMLNLIRAATGPGWKAEAIHLQMPFCAEASQFEEFSDTPPVFDQPASSIALPVKLLSLPLHHRRHEAAFLLKERESDALRQTAPALDLHASLRQLLHTHLRDGYPGIQRVADSAGTSVRSLQRRLEESGIAYSRLVEEVRFDLAVTLMADPAVKMKDIAQELGYRDCANFTRAFRRWAGVAPLEYRRNRLEE